MELVAANNYIICKPYKLKEDNKSLIVNNGNTDCFAEVISCKTDGYEKGDIIWYDKAFARECTIAGEKFIAVDKANVISTVEGV